MAETIFHLEPFPQFLRRVVELNRLYNPEDPLHEGVLLESDEEVRPAIGGGDDGAQCRKKLATIHREFPYGAPLHEQAAYTVRAFNGLRPFAEANHRTGWDYLSELLMHAGIQSFPGEDEGRALGNELWDRMDAQYRNEFGRHRVLDRDDIFGYLADWFRTRLA